VKAADPAARVCKKRRRSKAFIRPPGGSQYTSRPRRAEETRLGLGEDLGRSFEEENVPGLVAIACDIALSVEAEPELAGGGGKPGRGDQPAPFRHEMRASDQPLAL